ncbi:hypothetical protein GDO81_005424 [Engystomops pustulosus]|uniref:Uncharacterized protein n=1 Tax=Engystomops pustulosus TaxID=76066 RepID=A0AAV7CP62_ENGPU|nr:hypothetical protein GDO81_005424 [Engystomops pustulosus]
MRQAGKGLDHTNPSFCSPGSSKPWELGVIIHSIHRRSDCGDKLEALDYLYSTNTGYHCFVGSNKWQDLYML